MRFHSPPFNRGLTGECHKAALWQRNEASAFAKSPKSLGAAGDSQPVSVRLHRPSDRQQHAGVRPVAGPAVGCRTGGRGLLAAGAGAAVPVRDRPGCPASPCTGRRRPLAMLVALRRLLLRRRPRRLARRYSHDQARQRDAVRQRLELRLRRLGPVAGAVVAIAGAGRGVDSRRGGRRTADGQQRGAVGAQRPGRSARAVRRAALRRLSDRRFSARAVPLAPLPLLFLSSAFGAVDAAAGRACLRRAGDPRATGPSCSSSR